MSEALSAEQVQERIAISPFIELMGLTVVSADHDTQEITMQMPFKPAFERKSGTGQFHGGVIAALIDTVGDYALGMMVGSGLPTINFRTDYLRPAINTSLTATARVRRMGRSVGVADVDVFDDQGRLVAIGRGTYAMVTG